jgi:tetratricopeptide (TPR) repeat protein
MSLLPTRSRSDVGARSRNAYQALLALFIISFLCSPLFCQGAEDTASLSGTVHDRHGNAVANATVKLKVKDTVQLLTVQTDVKGKYHFATLHEGVYVLSTTMSGYQDAEGPPIFLGPREEKTVDLTLGAPQDPDKSASVTQPQFYDQPQFTVAGVMDTTNLGGHGSDTVVRTREKLAEETVTLGKASAGPSSINPAEEKSRREDVAREPSGFEANHRLGQVLIENGKAAEAISYLEKADRIKPGNYENAYDLALANADAGNLERARDSAKSLIVSYDKAELHHLLGNVEEKLGDPLEAVRQYQQAAELDPTESYVFDWGSELLLHHAPEPAIEVFTRGNFIFPRSERMLIGLGAALFAHGSNDDAIKRLCQASDLNPDDPSPYLFLGKMQRAEAAPAPEVFEKMHRFLTLHPESAQANYYYAVALWKLRKAQPGQASLQEITALLDKSVHLDPKMAAANLQLGIVRFEGGDFREAISDYQRAIALDPHMEEAHYRLAQAYRQNGEADKAKDEVKRYEECVKESAKESDRERHEIRQFVYTLRDQPTPEAR